MDVRRGTDVRELCRRLGERRGRRIELAGEPLPFATHRRSADFVRNITKHPQVRVLVHRGWRSGTATLLPDDDPTARSRMLPYYWDAAIGRALATTPLTIRIDLDSAEPGVDAAEGKFHAG